MDGLAMLPPPASPCAPQTRVRRLCPVHAYVCRRCRQQDPIGSVSMPEAAADHGVFLRCRTHCNFDAAVQIQACSNGLCNPAERHCAAPRCAAQIAPFVLRASAPTCPAAHAAAHHHMRAAGGLLPSALPDCRSRHWCCVRGSNTHWALLSILRRSTCPCRRHEVRTRGRA